VTTPQRTLVVAVIVAAVIGFATGWFARVWSEPTPGSRMREATEDLRERVRSFGR
jgi:hypothetical protein